MDTAGCWIAEIALLGSGIIYVHTIEQRLGNKKKLFVNIAVYFVLAAIAGQLQGREGFWLEWLFRAIRYLFLVCFLHMGRVLSWSGAAYYAIWAFMSWQLLFELCLACGLYIDFFNGNRAAFYWAGEILIFTAGYAVIWKTIGKWMPDGGQKKIGPRQFALAGLTFFVSQMIFFVPGNMAGVIERQEWTVRYLAQVLLAVVLYLQNELFKKSEMRQELEIMNLLWKKEQEQYRLSKENIALINQKCHDLKHQIRALRSVGEEERNQYLNEIEESVQIYEAIMKTGNEVLDTILTEKSLYCKERGITVSCVADGSQMGFINTVDLYAILGNAIDNAIEAVEKFEQKEMRQIDVMIYRQKQFLVMNVINPLEGNLIYEDGIPVTTKENKKIHGFGLKSIEYMVKKCDGILSISEEAGCFSLMILIPVPKTLPVTESGCGTPE